MKKSLLLLLLIIITYCSLVFAQKTKLEISPSNATVTYNGDLTKSPLNVKNRDEGGLVVAYSPGHVTYGETVEKITEKGSSLSISLERINRLPNNSTTKKIEFAKIADKSGKFEGGSTYTPFTGTIYKAPKNFDDSKWIKPIQQFMSDWGYNITGMSLFNEKGDQPEFIVAAEIVEFGKDTKGRGFQVSLVVDWSVYDVIKKKVVYNLRTGGYSDTNKKEFDDELIAGLQNAAIGLMSDDNFQSITLGKTGSSKPTGTDKTTTLSKIKPTAYDSYGEMIKNVKGSVVTIKTGSLSHGSGFLVSEEGLLITNDHVISGVDEKDIEIIFDNGFKMGAKIIKTNPTRDVALLRVSGSGFNPLPFNLNSSAIEIGNDVVAIGTPQDISYGQSVTKGIISGKRELENRYEVKQNYIQTDATINPGNSGGPLLNKEGEVIGIIVTKVMRDNTEGISFAIPIDEALDALNIKIK